MTSVGHKHSQTKIEDHIGALHHGRAHVSMSNTGNARQTSKIVSMSDIGL